MNDKLNGRHRIGSIAVLLVCGACAVLLGPAPSLSDESDVSSAAPASSPPTTAPSSDDQDRSDGATDRPAMRGRREVRDGGPRLRRPGMPPPPPNTGAGAPTTQERDEAIEFFRTHFPTRMLNYGRLPEGRPAKQRMAQMLVERYRRLQQMKTDDPPMYDLMMQQMRLQDEALTIQRQSFRAEGEMKAQFDSQLRDKVRELIEVSLQERQRRIDRLERQLQDQKRRLEHDMANPDALIDQHIQNMTNDADEVRKIRDSMQSVGTGGLGPPAGSRGPTSDQAGSGK